MSIYIGAGSAAHKMSKLYVGVDGKARQVQKMYVGVDGKTRLVYQNYKPIGSLAVGSIVKIKVNGVSKDFIVVCQGLPGSNYDSSCNGVWLLMKGIYTTMRWDSSYTGYKESAVHSYLNGTFYNLIDSNIQAAIKQVKIPYHNVTASGGSLVTGSNGLNTKVFLLSGTEVGFSSSHMDSNEGAKLPYFDSNSKRIAYNDSSIAVWWLRSPHANVTGNVWVVKSDGSSDYWLCSYTYGVRPAFILLAGTLVDGDGNVLG